MEKRLVEGLWCGECAKQKLVIRKALGADWGGRGKERNSDPVDLLRTSRRSVSGQFKLNNRVVRCARRISFAFFICSRSAYYDGSRVPWLTQRDWCEGKGNTRVLLWAWGLTTDRRRSGRRDFCKWIIGWWKVACDFAISTSRVTVIGIYMYIYIVVFVCVLLPWGWQVVFACIFMTTNQVPLMMGSSFKYLCVGWANV